MGMGMGMGREREREKVDAILLFVGVRKVGCNGAFSPFLAQRTASQRSRGE